MELGVIAEHADASWYHSGKGAFVLGGSPVTGGCPAWTDCFSSTPWGRGRVGRFCQQGSWAKRLFVSEAFQAVCSEVALNALHVKATSSALKLYPWPSGFYPLLNLDSLLAVTSRKGLSEPLSSWELSQRGT